MAGVITTSVPSWIESFTKLSWRCFGKRSGKFCVQMYTDTNTRLLLDNNYPYPT